jgi:hypothetical protein
MSKLSFADFYIPRKKRKAVKTVVVRKSVPLSRVGVRVPLGLQVLITSFDESGVKKRQEIMNDESDKSEIGDYCPNDGDVFQPIRVRRNIQDDIEHDEFLLDYSFNFLPYCGIIFWIISIIC